MSINFEFVDALYRKDYFGNQKNKTINSNLAKCRINDMHICANPLAVRICQI